MISELVNTITQLPPAVAILATLLALTVAASYVIITTLSKKDITKHLVDNYVELHKEVQECRNRISGQDKVLWELKNKVTHLQATLDHVTVTLDIWASSEKPITLEKIIQLRDRLHKIRTNYEARIDKKA